LSRRFHGSVLGYVTPWNSRGYDIAKAHRAKFTHISPVWYQLRAGSGSYLGLAGGHDVDQGWIDAVQAPHLKVAGPYKHFTDWSC
jgi:chitinase domain-containing protein 1